MKLNNKYSKFLKNILIFSVLSLSICSVSAQKENNSWFFPKSSKMFDRWELDSGNNRGTFILTPYKPSYINPIKWTSNLNVQPTSGNPAYTLPYKMTYKNYESKFQFSFKTKIARKIFWGNGDIWLAYTQKTYWQLFTDKLSRPIHDVNYEPEVILNFATKYTFLGFNGRMIGLILNHQSNGNTAPLSRGWNRIILQAGFEKNNWKVTLRPSFKLNLKTDGNPNIDDYAGRAEAIIVYNAGHHQLSSVITHSMIFNNGGKGSLQLNWVFPIFNNFKGLFQFFNGYGETLLDYNHKQTTIGVGVSFIEW